MPSKYYPGNQKIIDTLKRYRETPAIIHAEDIETHRVFLETGMGATIINSSSVIYTTAHENRLRAEALDGTDLTSNLDLVMFWKQKNATGFLQTFIEQVKTAQEKLKKQTNLDEEALTALFLFQLNGCLAISKKNVHIADESWAHMQCSIDRFLKSGIQGLEEPV